MMLKKDTSIKKQHVKLCLIILHCFINGGNSESLPLSRHDRPTPERVVGGVNATDGEFPFIVSLQMRPTFGTTYHYCAGIILDETHIVSTALCVDGRLMNQIEVVAGAYNFSDPGEQVRQQRRKLTSVQIHPRFDYLTQQHDIALLELDQPLEYNSYIQPVQLPQSSVEFSVNCSVIGYGHEVPDEQQVLQKLNMTRIPNALCQDIYQYIHEIDSETMICARGIRDDTYQGPCTGDSGGALLCVQETDSGVVTVAVGIFSWTLFPCGNPSFPSIYTNIALLSDFQSEK